MIVYKPPPKVRNEETVEQLKEFARATSPLDPAMIIERDAASIANAMKLIHGGEWSVKIDHQRRAVVVWATA